MTKVTNWQLLFVDDEEEICEQVKEYLEDESLEDGVSLQVTTLNKFEKALEILESHRFDLVILDVRLESQDPQPEEDAGISTLNAIKQKCFIPIVFYTGIPQVVRSLETPLIRVIEKTDGLPRLLEVLSEIVATGLPSINRALIRHLETIQRDYMWDFVATHWKQLYPTNNPTDLAYLLARRLAKSLSFSGIKQLAEDLGSPVPSIFDEGVAHPVEYYLMPPINNLPLTGDLYSRTVNEQISYCLVLTPSCDFVPRKNGKCKAEYVLLAQCFLLKEQDEYIAHQANNTKTTKSELEKLLINNRTSQPDRFYFLPGVLELPDLVVDFQRVFTLSREELDNFKRIASLDSPFAEALLVKFTRFFGRLGTPDLNRETIDKILQQIRGL